jgi:DNA-binding FadR family transcriptional regulator
VATHWSTGTAAYRRAACTPVATRAIEEVEITRWDVALERRGGKVAEWVARDLVREIASRRLPPGTRLPPENELLDQYGVSRPSLREAMRILEELGLVSMKSGPGGGPVVCRLSAAEYARASTFFFHVLGVTLRDLAEARVILDPLFARIAAERQDEAVVAQIRAFLAAARDESVGDDEDKDWSEDALAFHEALTCGTGNAILDLFAGALQVLYVERTQRGLKPADRKQSLAAHIAIAEAVLAGDGDRAEELMRAHTEQLVVDALERVPESVDELVDWR